MAGGEGKRFWPLSSREKPKQFLTLTGDKSLIRETVDRVLPLIPIERIFVVTVERYRDETLRHIPELPEENLVLEPEGKNTAPCIAYGTLKIEKKAGEAVVVVLPADHAVGDDQGFRDSIKFAAQTASVRLADGKFPIITLGVTPTSPETGYGYIKAGKDVVESSERFKAFNVKRFSEKPDLETALGFLKEGGYYWNSGVFVWKTSSILSEFAEIIPEWHTKFDALSKELYRPSEKSAAADFYGSIKAGSIDKLILEHSSHTAVVPVSFPWSDVGSWKALDEYLRDGEDENVTRGDVISIGSSGCLAIGGERVIAIVGLKDIVVVDSGDGILVLDKERSQDVRLVTEELEKRLKDS
jgi:mannose-1-phosphate guanylyltransferase